jgi:hypothetical protein
VLDVVRGSSGGIVVAEWTPGRSLREMAETRPSPIGAARAIAALAAGAELTHRSGGALSIDHPDRIRISVAGDAVLAFPGTLGDADVPSDVRGIGAMLYALMLARWPLGAPGNAITGASAPTSTVGGLRLADHTASGAPVEPRAVRPEVPFEISAVAVRALEPNQGVRTAATLQHVLEQASVVDQKTEMLPSLRVGQRAMSGGEDSEKNDSWRLTPGPEHTEPVRFVQMWVVPDESGLSPGYQQLEVDAELAGGDLVPIASGIDRDRDRTAITINNRYAAMHVARLESGRSVELPEAPYLHLFVTRGEVELEDSGPLYQGDAARMTRSGGQRVSTAGPAEILVWEMHARLGA